jgi:cellobiose dehydrogenase (acceptor)
VLLGGIGPVDQLEIVASSDDGPTFISEDEWINLPVGENLVDHTNVSQFLLMGIEQH